MRRARESAEESPLRDPDLDKPLDTEGQRKLRLAFEEVSQENEMLANAVFNILELNACRPLEASEMLRLLRNTFRLLRAHDERWNTKVARVPPGKEDLAPGDELEPSPTK